MNQFGWYFNGPSKRIVEVTEGDTMPQGEGEWEYLGSSDDLSPADVVAVVYERHPEMNVRLKLESKQGPGSGYYDMGTYCEID